MRKFTPEEKELIIKTPVTRDCFDMDNFIQQNETIAVDNLYHIWREIIIHLENTRLTYNETKDEKYFIELVRLLPNSYKVVKL